MTENKPIIIDGVDVSSCEFLTKDKQANCFENKYTCGMTNEFSDESFTKNAPFLHCSRNKNCLFKQLSRYRINECPYDYTVAHCVYLKELEQVKEQLVRKTQECDELKHNYNAIKQCNDNNMQTLDEAIKGKHEIECELEKVKKQYKCYSCGTCNGKEDYYNLAGHHENAIKSLHKTQQQLDQLKAENEELKRQYKELGQCSRRLKEYFDKEKETLSNRFLKLKQILTEIKEIASENKNTIRYSAICRSILKIIDEVE